MYDVSIALSPKIALLSILPGPIASQKTNLLRFSFYRQPDSSSQNIENLRLPPPLHRWITILNEIMLIEEKNAREGDDWEKHHKMWYVWVHYSTSDSDSIV